MRFCSTCGSRFSNDARYCPIDGLPTVEIPDEQPVASAMIGAVVDGRYRIERALGEGGMGVVYGATHVALQKRFAIKVLRGEMAKDTDVVQRFVQEAQSSSAIGHPNIVDISDFGRLPDGTFYFVMEYLDGETLTARIERTHGLPVAEALPILEMLTSALGAAHDRGIVHRDLKPDNIFLVRRGGTANFVKVLDFGIAKVGGAATKLTRTGMIFGTPHYMSPEQAAGQAVDRRTDIYSLGVIMYEMLTGRVPFDADTFMGILSKHMFEAPPRPTEIVPGPELGALEPIILRALVKKPEERYQSMEAVHRDLQTVARGGRIDSFTPSNAVVEFRASSPTFPMSAPSSSPPPRLPTRGASGRAILFGALALLGLGGLAGAAVHFVGTSDVTDAASAPPLAPPNPAIVVATTPRPPTPAPAIPPAPAAPPVRIESDPPAASVYAADSIVGTTPLDLPRPTSESLTFEVRLTGYRSRTIVVSNTTTSPLVATLEPERVVQVATTRPSTPRSTGTTSTTNRAPAERTPAMATEPATVPMTDPAPRPTRMPPDVLDPWQ